MCTTEIAEIFWMNFIKISMKVKTIRTSEEVIGARQDGRQSNMEGTGELDGDGSTMLHFIPEPSALFLRSSHHSHTVIQ